MFAIVCSIITGIHVLYTDRHETWAKEKHHVVPGSLNKKAGRRMKCHHLSNKGSISKKSSDATGTGKNARIAKIEYESLP
jgi:hypothetical protein